MKGTLLKLAAFVAVCGFFTVYLALTIGNIRLFRDTYELSATFDDVTGLLKDDNVKVAGVVVGKVTGIDVDKGRARVRFEVKDGVKLPTDSQAAVRWRNLLGQRYVYLYPGEASTVLEDDGAIGKTRSVVDLGELFNRLGPIIKAIDPKQVNTFLESVAGALDGNEEELRSTIDDLAKLTQGLATRDEAIGRLVENLDTVAGTITSRDQQIRTVLDNLLALSTTFSENTDVLDSAITELGGFNEDLGGLLRDNSSEIDRIVNNLTAIVQVVQGKLPVLDETVAGLDELADALFRSSRYGEWLNQDILCLRFGYPAESSESTPCDAQSTKPGGAPGGGSTATTGSTAVRRLVGSLVR